METLKQSALELILDAELLAEEVRQRSEHGKDISNNSLCGVWASKSILPQIQNPEEIQEIMDDLRLTINKLRLALFAPNMSNVDLNIIVNGQFINYDT